MTLACMLGGILATVFPLATVDASTEKGPEPNGIAPQPKVILRLDDPSPILGAVKKTRLTIDLENPPNLPLPLPRILCSVGEVENLHIEGESRFVATYLLPESRYPQPAILVAEFALPLSSLRGWLAVPLQAMTAPLFRTDPGAHVTLKVGEREFGPHTAPADGSVRIPVVVPLGVESALARSVNRYGKTTEQVLDLQVPYSQRVHLIAPAHLVAGMVAEIAVFAVDAAGLPLAAATLALEANPKAKIQPLGPTTQGEARFLLHAPRVLTTPNLELQAMIVNETTTLVKTSIPLQPARAARLSLVAEVDYLDARSRAENKVYLAAEDGYGNPIESSAWTLLVDGELKSIQKNGIGMTYVPITAGVRKKSHVTVEALLEGRTSRLTLPIRTPPPRPLLPERSLYPHYSLTPRLGILWNFGHAAGTSLLIEGIRHSRHKRGIDLGLSTGFQTTWFANQDDEGIAYTTLTTLPLLVTLSHRYVRERAFIGAEIGAGVAFGIASSKTFSDYRLTGYAPGAAANVALETGFLFPRGHIVLSLRFLALYLGRLSTGDRIKGNAGGAIADCGYRWVW